MKIDISCSATRNIPINSPHLLWTSSPIIPEQGDVVIGKITSVGQHTSVETMDGWEARLRPGIICALVIARRYSTREFHGEIPETLGPGENFHLLNSGGISGIVVDKNQLAKDPTRLEFVGYLANSQGQKENLKNHVLRPAQATSLPTVIMIVGADMDVGKTTSASWVIRALVRAGYKVSGIKLTGTARMKDLCTMADAGASPVIDFVDFGLPSTFGIPVSEMARMFRQMRAVAAENNCDYIVVELADGIFQPETYGILTDTSIMNDVGMVMFAAADGVAAYGGAAFLRQIDCQPDFLTGLFTCSALHRREVEARCTEPIFSITSENQSRFLEMIHQAHCTE